MDAYSEHVRGYMMNQDQVNDQILLLSRRNEIYLLMQNQYTNLIAEFQALYPGASINPRDYSERMDVVRPPLLPVPPIDLVSLDVDLPNVLPQLVRTDSIGDYFGHPQWAFRREFHPNAPLEFEAAAVSNAADATRSNATDATAGLNTEGRKRSIKRARKQTKRPTRSKQLKRPIRSKQSKR